MKKILSIFLIAVFLCVGGSSAYAARIGQSRIGLIVTESTGVCTPHTHVRTSPGLIYRIEFTANLALTWVAILDTATTGGADSIDNHLSNLVSGGNTKRVLVDIMEATAAESITIEYDPPIPFKHGLMVAYGTVDSAGKVVEIGQNANGIEAASIIIHHGE